MKYIKIALRNVSRQKKRSVLLGGAIALGILVITLVNGFTQGALENVKDNFSYLLAGHVYVSEETRREDGTRISQFNHPELVEQAIIDLGIDPQSIVRRSDFGATFLFHGKRASQQVQGVEWERETDLTERLILTQGSIERAMEDPRGIVISQQAAELLGIEIGEELTVRLNTVSGQQNAGTFVVHGFMADPGILGNLSAYTNIRFANELLNIPTTSYQSLNITLGSMNQVEPFTNALYEKLSEVAKTAPRIVRQEGTGLEAAFQFTFQDEPEDPWTGYRFRVTNINDFTAQIESLSQLLNSVGLGILMVLIVITLVGVANTFRMIMYERVKEIGTLRSLGMQKTGVRTLFLYEAFTLSILGYLGGLVVALLVGVILHQVRIPSDNAFTLFAKNGQLTFPLALGPALFNLILMSSLTVLAALAPANKAAKLQPADALRT